MSHRISVTKGKIKVSHVSDTCDSFYVPIRLPEHTALFLNAVFFTITV